MVNLKKNRFDTLSYTQCRNHLMKMKLAFHYIAETKMQAYKSSLRFEISANQNKAKMI